MKINKTAVINFRVTPEDKRNLDKLAAELCTNKTETLRFMLQYFSEMETDGVTAAKARLEMKNLRKRMGKARATLQKIENKRRPVTP